MTHDDAIEASRQLQADWIKAIKAVPALQERIKQGASFSSVMTQATQMAEAGFARLSMSDMKARAQFQLQMFSLPGSCENFARGVVLRDSELMQYMGVEPFKRQGALRIRALQAESAHVGTPRTVSRADYRQAVLVALRSLPFEDGERVSQLLLKGSNVTKYEECWAGHMLLKSGMSLPEPYMNIFIIYGVTRRFAPEPATIPPPARLPEAPGPRLGI